jgi:N-succinyldiaminopimelate aminotransferase
LRDGQAWVDQARTCYLAAGNAAATGLGLPLPQGSTFLFVNAEAALDERGMSGLLADCLADGVAVAPGTSCGQSYENWFRLCYTSEPPVEVGVAISKLAKRLNAS